MMDDIAAEFETIRRVAANITGFHALVEDETLSLSRAKRVEYEAQVYAGGVALAAKLCQLMERLDD